LLLGIEDGIEDGCKDGAEDGSLFAQRKSKSYDKFFLFINILINKYETNKCCSNIFLFYF